ncbi:DUF6320 domain-containing protein [Roseimarinus sediminis]|jgi:ribosomal protein L37E/heme/copper-type cytochrome/quinol oxidase subunit 4|uniref:DUF6320 domain-containing protein n=1 Tax=Roseimarinus sediminis TaxID=1610899 RepID=UPI003D25A710
MIYCRNCGVETEDNANFCALCGAPLSDRERTLSNDSTFHISEKKGLTAYNKLTGLQKRKIFWEIAGMIILSAILISLTINLVGDRALSWSKYVITVGLVLFIDITLISFWHKRLLLVLLLSFLTAAGFIFLLDLYSGNTGWGIHYGIPLLLSAYLIILFFVLLLRKARNKGLNVIAYALVGIGLMCLAIDGVIFLQKGEYEYAGWSLTVLVSTLLLSSLLLYVHHRLKRVTDLKRFFHI